MPTKTTKAPPKGPFVVINPRGIPKGRHILTSNGVKYFEGDVYAGDSAEHLLGRGVIQVGSPPKGGKVPKSSAPVLLGDGHLLPKAKAVKRG